MANVLLYEKGILFAVSCVSLYKTLLDERKEFILSKQMVRSGTSIGANISESNNAQSRADYVSKLSIALKEADETHYWIDLLQRTSYINRTEYESINNDLKELIAILTTLVKKYKTTNQTQKEQ